MSRTLLVTDDAMIIREMIKDAAMSAGWEIVGEAQNGQQAIELYEQLQPDAVTLDMVMPQYDGLYALSGIKTLDPDALVLVVSALDQKQTLKEAFRLGAADFIVKPFDAKNLVATLEKMVPSPAAV
jgi:two-component system, chemotaxis family, chemotaxis protein CheY